MITNPSASAQHRGHLLIVEDLADQQEIIRQFLRESLPEVILAFADGPGQALAYLQTADERGDGFPRLVLLDIHLPEAQMGWQLLQQLRTRYRRLPVVVLSAHYDTEAVLKAYQLGAHSFIAKPTEPEQWSRYMEMLRIYWLQTVTLPAGD